jgi:hypothetical protein
LAQREQALGGGNGIQHGLVDKGAYSQIGVNGEDTQRVAESH